MSLYFCLLHPAFLIVGGLHTFPIGQAGKAPNLSFSTVGDSFRSRTGVILGVGSHPGFADILYRFKNLIIFVVFALCVLLALFQSAFESLNLPWIRREDTFPCFLFFYWRDAFPVACRRRYG